MRGNITRRGRASWRLKFDVPPGPDGKRRIRFVTVRGSKKDAQQKLAELVASVGRGTFVESTKTTIAAHVRARIDVWYAAGKIGDATRERYGVLLKKQIAPHVGSMALQKVSTKDVEAWHLTMRKSGLSPRTCRHAHVLLAKALGDAVRHSLLVRNVAGRDGEGAPTVPKTEMKILRKDQIGGVVDKLRGTEIFPKALLALFCGLRAGEVLALQWRSVNLDGKVLHVRETVQEVAGQALALKRPKTDAGMRKVSVPDVVLDALRDHRRRQLELRMAMGLGRLADDALVFGGIDGGPTRRTVLSTNWREIVEAQGLPTVTFHQLRHTHVSQLIAARVDIATISVRLGHANPAITLKTYAHMFEENDGAAADAINVALGASSVPKTG